MGVFYTEKILPTHSVGGGPEVCETEFEWKYPLMKAISFSIVREEVREFARL